jgi:hypothetical protein
MAASVDTKASVFQNMLDSTRSETHKETQHTKRISETYRWPLATRYLKPLESCVTLEIPSVPNNTGRLLIFVKWGEFSIGMVYSSWFATKRLAVAEKP